MVNPQTTAQTVIQQASVISLIGLITTFAIEMTEVDVNISNKKVAFILNELNRRHIHEYNALLWVYSDVETEYPDELARTRAEVEEAIGHHGSICEYPDFKDGEQCDFVHGVILDNLYMNI